MTIEQIEQSERLQKMLQAFRLLRECGNYDTSISGALGEVYAEEILGMDKGKRGLENVDGWINGRSVQVKTKEIRDDWYEKHLSSRFVQLREGKQFKVDDLIVVMVHPWQIWTHYHGPISELQMRPANGVVRYHLHQMPGEGFDNYENYMTQLFPHASHKSSRKRTGFRNKSGHDGDNSIVQLNRLTIRQRWINKGITLNILDSKSQIRYTLPHDELIEIIQECSPSALISKSWLEGELYSWPSVSRAVHEKLLEKGYVMN